MCLEFKRYEDLINFVNKTLPADKRETPQVLLKTAIAYAAQGERLRALERYNRVLDLLTGQIGSFSDIASDLVRRIGAEEARKAFQTRLAQKPDERASKFVLSRLQRDAGGMDAFVTTVKGLLETVPADDPQAVGEKLFLMQSLATSYGQAGDYENARKTYEEILKINPYHVVALNNLAYVLIDHFNDATAAAAWPNAHAKGDIKIAGQSVASLARGFRQETLQEAGVMSTKQASLRDWSDAFDAMLNGDLGPEAQAVAKRVNG